MKYLYLFLETGTNFNLHIVIEKICIALRNMVPSNRLAGF